MKNYILLALLIGASNVCSKTVIDLISFTAPFLCESLANDFLDEWDSQAGKIYSENRYKSLDEANMEAAKIFGPASFLSQREPNWIVFKEKNASERYGFTYPAVSKRKQRKSNHSARVFDEFHAYKSVDEMAISMAHVHYDDNECFSYTDVRYFMGKNGEFYLLSATGILRTVNNIYTSSSLH